MAGQGYEVQRIVGPALDMRADRLHLLTDKPNEQLQPYLDGTRAALTAAGVELVVHECEVWDPNAVVGTMGEIARAEVDNHLYVNLGTGPKTCAIAATLAAMLWDFDAYYPRVDYTVTPALEGDHPIKSVTFVPTFHLEPPGGDVLAVLELLDERGGRPARKKDVVERLRERGFYGPGERSKQAEQNLADRILKRAIEWGFVDSKGEGRARRLSLNERGRAGRRMFAHLPVGPGREV